MRANPAECEFAAPDSMRGVLSLLDRSLIFALLTIAILPVFIRWIAAVIRRRFMPRHVDCIAGGMQDPAGENHVGT